MRKCLLIFSIIAATVACYSCGKRATVSLNSYQNYVVDQSGRGQDNGKWTDYLYYHLSKRAKKSGLVTKDFANNVDCIHLDVVLDSTLRNDYKIDRQKLYIELTARTPEIMLWLIYQFIAGVAEEDSRFSASDLPPAIIEPVSQHRTMAFEWRSIYSPCNSDPDKLLIRGTHHVDYNWGLWGHNLIKAVGMKPEYAATVGGKATEEQYCFSSEALYEAITGYIIETFGEGKATAAASISVMPLDNDMVCLCEECRKKGNTSQNATPAVAYMAERLAKRFPNHKFFVGAYSTTKTAPQQALPKNVGAIVSAIDVPMRADFTDTKGFAAFNTLLKEWKEKVGMIYVWDYTRNFDDYLTPYPCLKLFQSRARYYNNVGVSGLFVNGSGDSYSSFDDLQTYVISALLINHDANIEKLCRRFFKWYYPTSADILTDYYLSIETAASGSRQTLPFYGGISDSKRVFLDGEAFETFWKKLDHAAKSSEGNERKLLNQLLTALDFTRLELIRTADKLDKTAAAEALAVMEGYTSIANMRSYREANGSLADYISQWRASLQSAGIANALQGEPLSCTLPDDCGTADMLTDGKRGFASDYHTAWVTPSDSIFSVTIPSAAVAKASKDGKATLRIGFLLAPKWHLYTPGTTTISQAGRLLKSAGTPDTMQETRRDVFRRDEMEYPLDGIDTAKPIEIEMHAPGKARAHLAIDEITMAP